MNDKPNPIEVQKYLGGIDYPADKATIVDTARSSGADETILEALQGIPDREYEGPTGVTEAVARQ
ncbi:DUF2795 domain-containing protein [Microbacterium sp. NPDC089318]